MTQERNNLAHYGSIAGSVAAILGLLWLIGEPHLKNYIDGEIDRYDQVKKAEDLNKVQLRRLLSEKMQVADDEVHIELGKTYKQDKRLAIVIDSLEKKIVILEKKVADNYNEIGLNYGDIKKLNKDNEHFRKQLDKHGLFH